MQPQTATISSGRVFFSSLSHTTLPKRAALGVIAHTTGVEDHEIRLFSRLAAGVMPISSQHAFQAFRCHARSFGMPYVTTQ